MGRQGMMGEARMLESWRQEYSRSEGDVSQPRDFPSGDGGGRRGEEGDCGWR